MTLGRRIKFLIFLTCKIIKNVQSKEFYKPIISFKNYQQRANFISSKMSTNFPAPILLETNLRYQDENILRVLVLKWTFKTILC